MDVDKLITEVLHRVAIWNQAHPDHHNRHILTKLWNEIAIELNVTRDAAQKKWKYLRDYFRAECAKTPKPKSGDQGGNKLFKSNWPHYESMKFLLNQMKNRSSTGNLTQRTSTSSRPLQSQTNSPRSISPTGTIMVEPVDQVGEFTEMNHGPDDDNETAADDLEQEALDETFVEEPRYSIPSRKRRNRNEAIGNAFIEIEKQKLDILKARKVEPVIEPTLMDEDKNFFFSLLPHVKSIRPERKLLFRGQVQDLVQRFAYSDDYVFRPVSNRPITSTNTTSRSTPSTLDSSLEYFPSATSIEIEQLQANDSPVMTQPPSQSLLEENHQYEEDYRKYHNL